MPGASKKGIRVVIETVLPIARVTKSYILRCATDERIKQTRPSNPSRSSQPLACTVIFPGWSEESRSHRKPDRAPNAGRLPA